MSLSIISSGAASTPGVLGAYATVAAAVTALEGAGASSGKSIAVVTGTGGVAGAILTGVDGVIQSVDIDCRLVDLTAVAVSAPGVAGLPTAGATGWVSAGGSVDGYVLDDFTLGAGNRYSIRALWGISHATPGDSDLWAAGVWSDTGNASGFKSMQAGIVYSTGLVAHRVCSAYHAAADTPVVTTTASEHAADAYGWTLLDAGRTDPTAATAEANYVAMALSASGTPASGQDSCAGNVTGWVAVPVGLTDLQPYIYVDLTDAGDSATLIRLVVSMEQEDPAA